MIRAKFGNISIAQFRESTGDDRTEGYYGHILDDSPGHWWWAGYDLEAAKAKFLSFIPEALRPLVTWEC